MVCVCAESSMVMSDGFPGYVITRELSTSAVNLVGTHTLTQNTTKQCGGEFGVPSVIELEPYHEGLKRLGRVNTSKPVAMPIMI